jgi:hypothetical protein
MTMLPDVRNGDAAPGLEVWAKIGASLETVAHHMKRRAEQEEKLFATIHQVQLTCRAVEAANQVIDMPDTLGPRWGYIWDLRRLTLAEDPEESFEEGPVYVYNSIPSAVNLIDTFNAPGTHFYSKSTVLLMPHERIVLLAGPHFRGRLVPGGSYTQLHEDCLPLYLS